MRTRTDGDLGTAGAVADQIRNLAPPGQDVQAQVVLDAVRQGLFPGDPAPSGARRIGRFVLEEKLGSGGMGVVFAAWDPQLGRKVALKILRSPDGGSRASARLVREARALAKLRHPNVVTVHEVGERDGEVFIAMDFIEGSTLREWVKTPRSWRAIVDLFIDAGRGLAAAHDAGLVHRDFKPDNVLVDEQGTPHVADFGVARAARGPESHSHEGPPTSGGVEQATSLPEDGVEPTLTAAGALVGTPAYMAPEQLEGLTADPRSDQFSFCATLYEALYGIRPFPAASLIELVEAMQKFELAAPTMDRSVPRWLRRIVVRGLSIRPEDRFPSLGELLDRLEAGRRRRTRWIALGAAAAGAAGAAGATWAAIGGNATLIDCDTGPQRLQPVWNPTTQAAVREAFERSGATIAHDTWDRVEVELRAYADGWTAMHRDACRATHHRGEQSADMLQARMACLDRRLAELDGLLEIFESADAEVVARAAGAADALTPIEVCADAEDLSRVTATSPLPEDPRARERVERLRQDLARLRSFQNAGRYQAGLEPARALLEEAEALGYKPSIADAHYRLGSLLALSGEHAVAERHFETSFMSAVAGGDDATAAAVSATAAHVVGVVLRRHDDGDRWARIAESLCERVGNPPALAARTAQQRGNTAVLRGELPAGREALTRAVEGYREAGRQAELAETLVNLGVLERRAKNYDTALAHFDAAETQMRAFYGDHHPRLSTLWNNRAALFITLERWDEAEPELRRALEVMRSTVPPTHASLGHPLNNLGEVLAARGNHEDAIEHFDQAIEIWQTALGEQHPLVAYSLTERSLSRSALGRRADALRDAQLALRIREREGSSDSELARTRFALALALPDTDRPRAREQMLLARAVFEKNARTSDLARADTWLAQADEPAR